MTKKRGPEGISYAAVAQAADTLVSAKVRPTLRAVRDHVGSGSMSTIQMHLLAWNSHHPANLPQAISEDLARAVYAEINRHGEVAGIEAARQIEEARTACELITRESESLQLQLATATDEAENLRVQMVSLSGRFDQLRDDSASTESRLVGELSEVRNQLDICRERERDAEAGRREAVAKADAAAIQVNDFMSRLVACEKRATDAEVNTGQLLAQFLFSQNRDTGEVKTGGRQQ